MVAAATLTETPVVKISLARREDFEDAWQLLAEYFEAVHVVVRDDRAGVIKSLEDTQSGTWLAYCDGRPVGCIALRPLPSMSSKDHRCAEVKRLYVRPDCRRLGIALRLLSALESHATANGIQDLYLDSKDDLIEAHVFYERFGYRNCDRYNDNPQATIFMKKAMSLPIEVRQFSPGDEEAFWTLNEAWISKLFKLEDKDIQTLRNPHRYILSQGGRIYMACRGSERVGCCALLNMEHGSFEVAKMAVAECERGKGVGRTLLEYVVEDARSFGIRRLYLETNHALKNAIHLYEAVGFVHLRPEDVHPSPYARADVFMEMELA